MTITIEALKEKARGHEQNEEWRKALDLYLRAIRRLEEEERPDIGLHNRVGDLFTRVGDADEAVEHYETAVDLYDEAGLANNAIAVCKKIVRNVPDRHRVFLRMGLIRASQGFLVDARHHFLTYAERMKAAGDLDEALRALVEFADLVPGDAEIRLAIASQFEQHDRPPEAAAQLARAYQILVLAGEADEAAAVGERLVAMRPETDLDELASSADPGAPLEAASFSPDDLALPVTVPGAEPEVSEFEISLPGDVPAAAADEPDLEDRDPDDRHEADAIGAASHGSGPETEGEASEDFEEIEIAAPLPYLTFDDRDDDEEALEAVETGLADEDGEALEAADTELADEDEGAPPSLPYLEGTESLGMPAAEPAPPAPSLAELDAADAWTDPRDEQAEVEATERMHAALEEALSEVEAERAAEAEGGTGDPRRDDEVAAPQAPEVAGEAVDAVELHQRAVERAFRGGSEADLIAAYAGLAEALEGSGAGERARGVYQQILGLDPSHAGARAALGRISADPGPAPEVASSEDYVDLGALILGDEQEKTTRFVVAYEEPSGDEDADFARMLSQFKAKVAENVDSTDVRAHHDLGVAYREMGLLDEAIEQFQKALRASTDHLATYEALGQAFLDKGAYAPAVRVLTRALNAPWEVEDELLGIYYYLGRAYEAQGNTPQAVEFYDRVFSLDINFADVTERLRVLR
jgi:tetratricopeptide (TPR) repeat protein